jgi:hypothetical protein
MENEKSINVERERIYEIWDKYLSNWKFQSCYPSLEEVESQYSINGQDSPENERCLVVHPERIPESDISMLAKKSYILLCESGSMGLNHPTYSMIEVQDEQGLAKEIAKYITKKGPGSRSKIKVARAFDLTKVGIRAALREHGLEDKLDKNG